MLQKQSDIQKKMDNGIVARQEVRRHSLQPPSDLAPPLLPR